MSILLGHCSGLLGSRGIEHFWNSRPEKFATDFGTARGYIAILI